MPDRKGGVRQSRVKRYPNTLTRSDLRGQDDYVYSTDESERGILTGGTRHCRLEGCIGIRLGVRWPDGRLTWPCTKGMEKRPDGSWRIC